MGRSPKSPLDQLSNDVASCSRHVLGKLEPDLSVAWSCLRCTPLDDFLIGLALEALPSQSATISFTKVDTGHVVGGNIVGQLVQRALGTSSSTMWSQAPLL